MLHLTAARMLVPRAIQSLKRAAAGESARWSSYRGNPLTGARAGELRRSEKRSYPNLKPLPVSVLCANNVPFCESYRGLE